MGRSKLDQKQIYEYESSVFIEKTIIRNGWKYREQEKDNDIDGEIEVFSKEGETTAKIIKVQLKATKELKYDKESIIFDCPIKFLNFCDVCDIPVILVVYGVDNEKAYWVWTQKYIFQSLDSKGIEWRSNTSKIRMKISIANEVREGDDFYNDLEYISKEGINELQQWRKQETSNYYYTILEEKDSSALTKRRISAKVYIERSFATSRDSMVALIKKINEKVKNNNYYKNVLKETSPGSEPDYVWLYLYDDLIQYESGLPFCRTEWLNPKEVNEPILLKEFDKVIEDSNLRIKWESSYRPLQEYLLLNATSKTLYLESIRTILSFVMSELDIISRLFSKENKAEFYNHVNSQRMEYTKNFLATSDLLPPFECREFNNILNESLTDLDNLAIAVEQKLGNEYYLNSQYIQKFSKQIVILEYELKKIL